MSYNSSVVTTLGEALCVLKTRIFFPNLKNGQVYLLPTYNAAVFLEAVGLAPAVTHTTLSRAGLTRILCDGWLFCRTPAWPP
jgi:hypothetical protein